MYCFCIFSNKLDLKQEHHFIIAINIGFTGKIGVAIGWGAVNETPSTPGLSLIKFFLHHLKKAKIAMTTSLTNLSRQV